MPVATEIVYLPLREGVNPEEAGSAGALQWSKCCTTISQQTGFIRQYWGTQVENPQVLVTTIDWEDVQDHINFVITALICVRPSSLDLIRADSEPYKPFTAELAEIFDFSGGPPFLYHVPLTSDSVAAREAPVTEFAPFSVSATTSDSDKSAFEDKIVALGNFVREDAKCLHYAVGWSLEEFDNEKAAGGKTKLFQGLLGWNSVDDHMEARENKQFGDFIGPIRASVVPPVPDTRIAAMFHVKLHE